VALKCSEAFIQNLNVTVVRTYIVRSQTHTENCPITTAHVVELVETSKLGVWVLIFEDIPSISSAARREDASQQVHVYK